jgi:hypothetical protein
MDFRFSDDQKLFQQTVREFLVAEVTPERIRASWQTPTGRSDANCGRSSPSSASPASRCPRRTAASA